MLHKCLTDCIWKRLQPINDLQGNSRSLPLLPFDRPCTISHWSSIVSISVSCTVFEILTLICQKWRRHVTRPLPSKGQFVITRQALLGPIRGLNLTIVFLAIPEKFKGVYNSKMDHVTVVTPFQGRSVVRQLTIDIACNHTKFDDASFSRSEDISWGVKF